MCNTRYRNRMSLLKICYFYFINWRFFFKRLWSGFIGTNRSGRWQKCFRCKWLYTATLVSYQNPVTSKRNDLIHFITSCRAALIGNPRIVDILVGNGANVNILSKKDHLSPLNYAVYHKDETMVIALLDAGANVNNPNGDGLSPLDQALKTGDGKTRFKANE